VPFSGVERDGTVMMSPPPSIIFEDITGAISAGTTPAGPYEVIDMGFAWTRLRYPRNARGPGASGI
jgi:hypothetical protein